MSTRAQLSAQRRLGRWLRRTRGERRLSLQNVADYLGCSRQFVSDLERGVRQSADIRLWMHLASLFECGSRDLVLRAWQARGALALPALSQDDQSLLRIIDAVVAEDWKGSGGGYRDA